MTRFECVEHPDPHQQRLANLEAQVADMDELYRRLDHTSLELVKASAALDQAYRERDEMQRDVERMRAVMESTWSSLSWRVTRPLRKLKSLTSR
jgi:hypothetical protein